MSFCCWIHSCISQRSVQRGEFIPRALGGLPAAAVALLLGAVCMSLTCRFTRRFMCPSLQKIILCELGLLRKWPREWLCALPARRLLLKKQNNSHVCANFALYFMRCEERKALRNFERHSWILNFVNIIVGCLQVEMNWTKLDFNYFTFYLTKFTEILDLYALRLSFPGQINIVIFWTNIYWIIFLPKPFLRLFYFQKAKTVD